MLDPHPPPRLLVWQFLQVGVKAEIIVVVSLLGCVWLFCHPMDGSSLGSSVHRILKARIVEWVAISFSRGSSPPGLRSLSLALSGKFFTSEPLRKPGCRKRPLSYWRRRWDGFPGVPASFCLPQACLMTPLGNWLGPAEGLSQGVDCQAQERMALTW